MDNWIQILWGALGGAGATVALAKLFGEGVIKHWFATQAEKQAQAHREQLEELRLSINLAFARYTRVHDREFEVLPEAWRLMMIATGEVARAVDLVRDLPDLEGATSTRLEEILSGSEFSEAAMEEVRESSNRNRAYAEACFWRDLNRALATMSSFSNYLLINSLFLPRDIREAFMRQRDLLMDAAHGMRCYRQFDDYVAAKNAMIALGMPSETQKKEIEALVQARLDAARSMSMPL